MESPGQEKVGLYITQMDPFEGKGSLPQTGQSSGRRVSFSQTRMKDPRRASVHQLRLNTGEHDPLLPNQILDPDLQGIQRQPKKMCRKRTLSLDPGSLASKGMARKTSGETRREINQAEQGPRGEDQKPEALWYNSNGIHSAGFPGGEILRTKSAGEADSRSKDKMTALLKFTFTRPLRNNLSQETPDLQSKLNQVNRAGQENGIQVVVQILDQKEQKQIQEPAPTQVQEKESEDCTRSNKTRMTRHNALCKRKVPLWVTAVCTLLFLAAATAAVVMAIHSATKSRPCPKQWIWIEGKCYYFSEDTKDWKSSQAFCSSYGGSLALLKDPRILDSSTRFKDGRDYWVGLRKTGEAGRQKWQWVDGSDFQREVVFIESEGPELDCAYLNSDKTGNLNCASMRPWICVGEGNWALR